MDNPLSLTASVVTHVRVRVRDRVRSRQSSTGAIDRGRVVVAYFSPVPVYDITLPRLN